MLIQPDATIKGGETNCFVNQQNHKNKRQYHLIFKCRLSVSLCRVFCSLPSPLVLSLLPHSLGRDLVVLIFIGGLSHQTDLFRRYIATSLVRCKVNIIVIWLLDMSFSSPVLPECMFVVLRAPLKEIYYIRCLK